MLIFEFILIQTIVFVVIILVLRRLMLKDTTSAVNRLKLVDEDNAKRLEAMKQKIKKAEAEYEKQKTSAAENLRKKQNTIGPRAVNRRTRRLSTPSMAAEAPEDRGKREFRLSPQTPSDRPLLSQPSALVSSARPGRPMEEVAKRASPRQPPNTLKKQAGS